MKNLQQLREKLLKTDEGFRQLAEQHNELEARLSELSHQLSRTSKEELEKATLKKRKLLLKDQMEGIIRSRQVPEAVGAPALQ